MRSITASALCLLAVSVFVVLPSPSGSTSPPLDSGGSISSSKGEKQPSAEYPTEGSKCYDDDLGQTRAFFGSCTKYLECNSDSVWRKADCPDGSFYTEQLQTCVPPEMADCAASIFGREAQILIQNAGQDLVLTDCQNCVSSPFPSNSPVTGFGRLPENSWSQILVARRRGGSDYYSFAFNRTKEGKFKVMTEITSTGKISSRLFKQDPFPDNNAWRVVPTADSARPNEYRIVSPATKLSLTLTDGEVMGDDGKTYRALEMQELGEKDRPSSWGIIEIGVVDVGSVIPDKNLFETPLA